MIIKAGMDCKLTDVSPRTMVRCDTPFIACGGVWNRALPVGKMRVIQMLINCSELSVHLCWLDVDQVFCSFFCTMRSWRLEAFLQLCPATFGWAIGSWMSVAASM